MAHILMIDDDAALREMTAEVLERDGHQVIALSGGAELTERHERWADCILLDVMMPGEDGFEICRRIRAQVDCPILMLTAKTAEADVLAGLGLGADDYLCKPVRIAELRARVNAHLRREQRERHTRLVRGDITLDMSERLVCCGGREIRLTRGEYALLELLALHPGQTFSREQLYERAFGLDGRADAATVTEHIRSIRAKLSPANPIKTVWGVGYKWKESGDPSA